MIISRTPFRVSFFGGGTDYPVWYRDHGGRVISTAIDKYCYVTLRELPPFFNFNYLFSRKDGNRMSDFVAAITVPIRINWYGQLLLEYV